MVIQSFKELIVWNKAMELVPSVYGLVRRLPKEEVYALGDEMRRAVVSVPANIAEGHSRQYRREYVHHLSVARGSLAEVETLVLVGVRLGYFTTEGIAKTQAEIEELRKTLCGLIQRLKG